MPTLLHQYIDMLERMEIDLATKAAAAFVAAEVNALVYGVFSLDDLEKKTENQLSQKIGVGVAYSKCAPLEIDFNSKNSASPGQSSAVRMIGYEFLVVLAVPTGEQCNERYNATKLLTVLRRSIHGSTIDGDASSRKWNFQSEKPQPGESSETMLYYTQVWQVALPLIGPT